MSRRIQRLNELVGQELSKIILREIEFPPGVLVTVTRAETSLDLTETKVYISAISSTALSKEDSPDVKAAQILKILNSQVYFLQQKLNKKLGIKILPRIKFLEEKKLREAAEIEEILEKIKQGNE